jgi:hypothetical protein
MSDKAKKLCEKIPDVDERADLWAQLQCVAKWIFEIADQWWDDDDELRRHIYRKNGFESDDTF